MRPRIIPVLEVEAMDVFLQNDQFVKGIKLKTVEALVMSVEFAKKLYDIPRVSISRVSFFFLPGVKLVVLRSSCE